MPIKEFKELTSEELAQYDNVPFVNDNPIFRELAFKSDVRYFTKSELIDFFNGLKEEMEYKSPLTKEQEEMYKEEQNKIISQLPRVGLTIDQIAELTGKSVDDVVHILQ